MRPLLAMLILVLASTRAVAADLQLQAEALPGSTVHAGDPVTLRFTLTNLGPDASPLGHVSVAWSGLPLPAAVSCPHRVAVPRPDAGQGVAWHILDFGDTPAGTSETCDMLISGIPRAGIYPIPAQTFSQIDPNPQNNTAEIRLNVFAAGVPVPLFGAAATTFLGVLVLLVGVRVRRSL